MYVGVKELIYKEIYHCSLENMSWESHTGASYLPLVLEVVHKVFEPQHPKANVLLNLMLFILENVHDHGSGKCRVIYGKNDVSTVIEVFEEFGGFDLRKLPKGTGGWGYRTMQRSEWKVSHSKDGKRTFVELP